MVIYRTSLNERCWEKIAHKPNSEPSINSQEAAIC